MQDTVEIRKAGYPALLQGLKISRAILQGFSAAREVLHSPYNPSLNILGPMSPAHSESGLAEVYINVHEAVEFSGLEFRKLISSHV